MGDPTVRLNFGILHFACRIFTTDLGFNTLLRDPSQLYVLQREYNTLHVELEPLAVDSIPTSEPSLVTQQLYVLRQEYNTLHVELCHRPWIPYPTAGLV